MTIPNRGTLQNALFNSPIDWVITTMLTMIFGLFKGLNSYFVVCVHAVPANFNQVMGAKFCPLHGSAEKSPPPWSWNPVIPEQKDKAAHEARAKTKGQHSLKSSSRYEKGVRSSKIRKKINVTVRKKTWRGQGDATRMQRRRTNQAVDCTVLW